MNKNLFATVLTYPAPSSNYRGESEENRTVLQKITKQGKDYPVISPESMRNALREMLITAGLPYNRKRLHNEKELAVEYKELPNEKKYADDFLFGFMVADKERELRTKRDSILRMNMAVALTPYRFNAIFHQSPLNAGASPWKNAKTSALIHREVSHTAFQYPFALSQQDCVKGDAKWTKELLAAIAQLTNVAGGHARSYYEMTPRSIVARLTKNLVAGYDTYGFDEHGNFQELDRINDEDLPANEFWIGGELARNMEPTKKQKLKDAGVHFYDNPQKLLTEIGEQFLAQGAN